MGSVMKTSQGHQVPWKLPLQRFCGNDPCSFTTLLSDGNAKTHKYLQELAVYGSDVEIKKDGCLNHIAKCLGSGLRNTVKEWKIKKVTLGGKKPGDLKEETIPQTFQVFGDGNSWCFYNRALAQGEHVPPHDGTTMKTVLLPEIVSKIIPVYRRLAGEELLKGCTTGKTQNANESLHSVICSRCPKDVFVSKRKLDLAIMTAVSEFNMGCEATTSLRQCITLSPAAQKICERRDKRRLQNSASSSQSGSKSARKRLKLSKSAVENKKKIEEGPIMNLEDSKVRKLYL
ncbi:hypothetical protein ANN_27734 [Periplaneta americana]|uniref:Uncharacterized protein n=1 Tax=Periplaneta americana TaxID=6978 RepID=A0ABQ8RV71_PERAM|nr:hypothetical protein ANN_27734 [Periplaneta americana]